MNPAPPLSARPAIGTQITISSTRRDKDADGVVLAHDEVGIRIRCADEVGEMAVERFYPWGQVAFTQWAAPRIEVATPAEDELVETMTGEEVVAELNAEGEAALAAEAQATGADLAADVAAGLVPQIQVRQRLDAWRGQPGEDCWDENFAQRLRDEGFPVEVFTRREAETREIIPAETSWDGGALGDAIAGGINVDDDRKPGDPFLKPVGQMLVRPAQMGYRVPEPILDLAPDHDLALWAAINHTPAELNTIYSLHEGHFSSYINKLRRGDRPSDDDGDDESAWTTP